MRARGAATLATGLWRPPPPSLQGGFRRCLGPTRGSAHAAAAVADPAAAERRRCRHCRLPRPPPLVADAACRRSERGRRAPPEVVAARGCRPPAMVCSRRRALASAERFVRRAFLWLDELGAGQQARCERRRGVRLGGRARAARRLDLSRRPWSGLAQDVLAAVAPAAGGGCCVLLALMVVVRGRTRGRRSRGQLLVWSVAHVALKRRRGKARRGGVVGQQPCVSLCASPTTWLSFFSRSPGFN